jgi:hypothetical protein
MFERVAGLWRRLTHRPAAGAVEPAGPAVVSVPLASAGDAAAPPDDAKVLGISKTAARLLARRRFEPGALVGVGLPTRAGETATVLACVLRATPRGSDAWELACRFSTDLTAMELSAFRGPPPPAGRNGPPIPIRGRARYHLVPRGEATPHDGQVIGLSSTCLSLLVEEAVPIGALLSIDLHAPNGDQTGTMLACVVFVEVETDGRRRLRCDFIGELSAAAQRKLAGEPGGA